MELAREDPTRFITLAGGPAAAALATADPSFGEAMLGAGQDLRAPSPDEATRQKALDIAGLSAWRESGRIRFHGPLGWVEGDDPAEVAHLLASVTPTGRALDEVAVATLATALWATEGAAPVLASSQTTPAAHPPAAEFSSGAESIDYLFWVREGGVVRPWRLRISPDGGGLTKG